MENKASPLTLARSHILLSVSAHFCGVRFYHFLQYQANELGAAICH